METTYSPKDCSDRLGVSMSTIRRYGDKLYQDGALSEIANPTRAERKYTPHDLRIMAYAVRAKSAGMTVADAITAAAAADDDVLPTIEELEALPADSETVSDGSDSAESAEVDAVQPLAKKMKGLPMLASDSASLSLEMPSIDRLVERLDDTDALRESIAELAERLSEVERKLDSLPGIVKRW